MTVLYYHRGQVQRAVGGDPEDMVIGVRAIAIDRDRADDRDILVDHWQLDVVRLRWERDCAAYRRAPKDDHICIRTGAALMVGLALKRGRKSLVERALPIIWVI